MPTIVLFKELWSWQANHRLSLSLSVGFLLLHLRLSPSTSSSFRQHESFPAEQSHSFVSLLQSHQISFKRAWWPTFKKAAKGGPHSTNHIQRCLRSPPLQFLFPPIFLESQLYINCGRLSQDCAQRWSTKPRCPLFSVRIYNNIHYSELTNMCRLILSM